MTRPTMIHTTAPPERLATLRIVVGTFAVIYLAGRTPVLLGLHDRAAAGFDGVGVLTWRDAPLDDVVVTTLVVVALLLSRNGFTAGATFRLSGPLALSALVLTTYRSSWGQLLHFENLVVLHLVILGFAASADAWSFDAARRARAAREGAHDGAHDGEYRGPCALACIVVVVAYVIAGVAKLRYGGIEWVVGDSLRHHIAYSAARLELLGGTPSPLARPVVERAWLLPPMAAASVAIELSHTVALLGRWPRTAWVASAWAMHAADRGPHARDVPLPAVPRRLRPVLRARAGRRVMARASGGGADVTRARRHRGSVGRGRAGCPAGSRARRRGPTCA